MKSKVLAVAILAVGSSGAAAQWIEGQPNENPFEKTRSQWVFTVKNAAVFGFSCDGQDVESARLIFVTPERAEDSAVATLNRLKPQLSIIIDNGERADLDAELDGVEVLGSSRLRVIAQGQDALEIVGKLATARKRVSVALSALAQTFHATNFGVRGSGRALRKALATCGIELPGAPT